MKYGIHVVEVMQHTDQEDDVEERSWTEVLDVCLRKPDSWARIVNARIFDQVMRIVDAPIGTDPAI